MCMYMILHAQMILCDIGQYIWYAYMPDASTDGLQMRRRRPWILDKVMLGHDTDTENLVMVPSRTDG